MNQIYRGLRGAIASTLLLALVCCGLYPLAVYGLARAFFPRQSIGSLWVDADGTVRGSRLIGQTFSGESYFHGRPSSAGTGYDAANSSGSNLGPTSQKLADSIQQNIADYRQQNGLATNQSVPGDAVTASASGLDPHISPANAELQVARVAKARGLDPQTVRRLVLENSDSRGWGVFGDPGVNVLSINLALDRMKKTGASPR